MKAEKWGWTPTSLWPVCVCVVCMYVAVAIAATTIRFWLCPLLGHGCRHVSWLYSAGTHTRAHAEFDVELHKRDKILKGRAVKT